MTAKTGLCPYMDAQDQMNQHKQTSWDWHVADREGVGGSYKIQTCDRRGVGTML